MGRVLRGARSKSLDPLFSTDKLAADTAIGARSALEAPSITEAKWLHGTNSNLLGGLDPEHIVITNRERLDLATHLQMHTLVVTLVTDAILGDDGAVTPAKVDTGRILLLLHPGLEAGGAGGGPRRRAIGQRLQRLKVGTACMLRLGCKVRRGVLLGQVRHQRPGRAGRGRHGLVDTTTTGPAAANLPLCSPLEHFTAESRRLDPCLCHGAYTRTGLRQRDGQAFDLGDWHARVFSGRVRGRFQQRGPGDPVGRVERLQHAVGGLEGPVVADQGLVVEVCGRVEGGAAGAPAEADLGAAGGRADGGHSRGVGAGAAPRAKGRPLGDGGGVGANHVDGLDDDAALSADGVGHDEDVGGFEGWGVSVPIGASPVWVIYIYKDTRKQDRKKEGAGRNYSSAGFFYLLSSNCLLILP